MTSEYRDQMAPVAASADDWNVLSLCAGLLISASPAITRPWNNNVLLNLCNTIFTDSTYPLEGWCPEMYCFGAWGEMQ